MNVRKNLIANLIGQGWSAVLNLATVPIYLALVGVESFGLIGFAVVILVLASLLDGGLATTINRAMVLHRAGQTELTEARNLLRSCECAIGLAALLLTLAAIATGPVLASFWLQPEGLDQDLVSASVVIMCIIALMRVVEAIYRAALLGLDKAVRVNVLSVISATFRVLGPIPFIVYLDGTVLTYFWVGLGVSVLSLAVFYAATHKALEGNVIGFGRFSLPVLRGAMTFAGTAFVIAALGALANQMDKLFVARFSALDELGLYSVAAVVAAGVYQIVLPVFHSFYPKLSYLHATGTADQFDRLALRLALVIGFVAGVPIAVLMLNATDVMFAWTGNAEVAERAGPLLIWLCLGSLGNALFHAPLAALLARGRQAIAAATTIGMTVALLPILYCGWRLDGLEGVAAAWGVALAAWYLATLAGTAWLVLSPQARGAAVLLSVGPFVVAIIVSVVLHEAIGSLPPSQIARALAVIAIALVVTLATAGAAWLADRRLNVASTPAT